MPIYQNTRNFRLLIIIWILGAAFIASLVFGTLAWRDRNMFALDNWFVIGLLSFMFFVGVEFYMRRYVTNLEVKGAHLVVTTHSFFGRHTAIDYGQMGEQKHDKGLEFKTAAVISLLTQSLHALRFSGINNQYHILKIGQRKTKYIVDVTKDKLSDQTI